jgi:prepilin-type N-terminal cleavage/methylation domain-containing protein
MRKLKGFTLVEVLIVVIIIAILAALVVPRFLSQPEKAVLAEANQMLGAIARAQNTYVDSGTGTAWLAVDATTNAANWAKIGMQAPSATNFTYACTGDTSCTAVRGGSGDYAGATITVTKIGGWTCTGGTATKKYAANTAGGCSV